MMGGGGLKKNSIFGAEDTCESKPTICCSCCSHCLFLNVWNESSLNFFLAAVLKLWTSFFTLHCSSSFGYINEYLAIDSGGYVYGQPSRINCSIWMDASQRS